MLCDFMIKPGHIITFGMVVLKEITASKFQMACLLVTQATPKYLASICHFPKYLHSKIPPIGQASILSYLNPTNFPALNVSRIYLLVTLHHEDLYLRLKLS